MTSQPTSEYAHDPKARAVAKAVYDALRPRSVILFGSRARGDFRRDSDIDLLVITEGDRRLGRQEYVATCKTAHAKAGELYEDCGFGVDVLDMTSDEFRHRRRAKNHVAGQAARDGVDMNGDRIPPDNQPPDNSPDILQRIANAKRELNDMNVLVENERSSQEAVGFHAQQAVENALKGWISALDDEYRNIHDIAALAAIVRKHPEEEDSDAGEQLFWLTKYAVKYRYEGAIVEMDDRHELLHIVSETVLAIIERIGELTGSEE